jgi:hypothetical protein
MANPTVTSPVNNASVTNPFLLSASDKTCNGVPVVSMGYSLDSLPDAAVVRGTSISTQVSASTGNHLVRVKAWAKHTSCVTEVAVTVSNPPAVLIPSYAISSGDLNGNTKWKCQHDDGTSGTSSGGMDYPLTLGGYSDVQEFAISSYSNHGGERCSIDFVKDTTTHNFIYDVWVQTPNPSLVGNLELDMNQVTTNGDTVIFAFQCDGFKGKWDYSYVSNTNGGASGTHWVPSSLPCNVQKWAANTWYHVQISTSRDDSGNVTYNWVALNGVVGELNVTTYQQEALNWGIGDTMVNFQLDPAKATGNPVIVYAHDLTIYRW